MLFDMSKNAVINIDADYSDRMILRVHANRNAVLYTFGLSDQAMIRASQLEAVVSADRIGTEFTVESPWYRGVFLSGCRENSTSTTRSAQSPVQGF